MNYFYMGFCTNGTKYLIKVSLFYQYNKQYVLFIMLRNMQGIIVMYMEKSFEYNCYGQI